MPLTKKQIKILAAKAWTHCYEYLGLEKGYCIEIDDGDKDVILPLLEELAEDMNNRCDNSDFICAVEYEEDNKYYFYVYENEDKIIPCYQYDCDDEDDKEVVAHGAEVIDSDNPAPDDPKWNDIRTNLMETIDYTEFWQNDHLCLALNWGNSVNDGRHEKTSEEDWVLFKKMTNPYLDSNQERCYQIYKNLCEERLKIYWNLEGENYDLLKETY